MSTDTVEPKCEHCLTVNLHQGTTHGSVEQLGTYPCYVSRYFPPTDTSSSSDSSGSNNSSVHNKHTCIVLFTDIFGYQLPNIRLLADKLGLQSQLTVYVPDILFNDSVSPDNFDRATFPIWRSKHGDNETLPCVKDILYHLRNEYHYTKIGGWGFCFGGRYAALASSNTFTTIKDTTTVSMVSNGSPHLRGLDAYAVAHPSFITIDDFDHLTIPGLFLCAETDMQFPLTLANEVEKVLVQTKKIPHTQFKYYPGTTHGFTVRGNENDPVVVQARDDALHTAATFFRTVLE